MRNSIQTLARLRPRSAVLIVPSRAAYSSYVSTRTVVQTTVHVSLDTPDLSLSPPIPTESESTVVDLQVARGQRIHQGDTLGFIETSYTIRTEIKAPCSGVLRRVLVEDGNVLEEGEDLFIIEPISEEESDETGSASQRLSAVPDDEDEDLRALSNDVSEENGEEEDTEESEEDEEEVDEEEEEEDEEEGEPYRGNARLWEGRQDAGEELDLRPSGEDRELREQDQEGREENDWTEKTDERDKEDRTEEESSPDGDGNEEAERLLDLDEQPPQDSTSSLEAGAGETASKSSGGGPGPTSF